jgi:hypothetical protein
MVFCYLIRLKTNFQKEINKCNITSFITIYSWLIFSNLKSDYQVLIRFAFLPDFMESKHFSKLAIMIIVSLHQTPVVEVLKLCLSESLVFK